MIFHEKLSAGRRFSCNIIPYFCWKLGKMSQNLSSAAVIIGALRVNRIKIGEERNTVKPVLSKLAPKRTPKIGFKDRLLLNAGQKYCRMLQGELSAFLPTFMKLPFVNKIFVLSIFVWPLKTGFTVHLNIINISLTRVDVSQSCDHLLQCHHKMKFVTI